MAFSSAGRMQTLVQKQKTRKPTVPSPFPFKPIEISYCTVHIEQLSNYLHNVVTSKSRSLYRGGGLGVTMLPVFTHLYFLFHSLLAYSMLLFVAFPCLAVGGIILLLTNMQVNPPFSHYCVQPCTHCF